MVEYSFPETIFNQIRSYRGILVLEHMALTGLDHAVLHAAHHSQGRMGCIMTVRRRYGSPINFLFPNAL